jgi:hypothetical protein
VKGLSRSLISAGVGVVVYRRERVALDIPELVSSFIITLGYL